MSYPCVCFVVGFPISIVPLLKDMFYPCVCFVGDLSIRIICGLKYMLVSFVLLSFYIRIVPILAAMFGLGYYREKWLQSNLFQQPPLYSNTVLTCIVWPKYLLPFVEYFISIKPQLSDQLFYATFFSMLLRKVTNDRFHCTYFFNK